MLKFPFDRFWLLAHVLLGDITLTFQISDLSFKTYKQTTYEEEVASINNANVSPSLLKFDNLDVYNPCHAWTKFLSLVFLSQR